jgi:hypothetical protein
MSLQNLRHEVAASVLFITETVIFVCSRLGLEEKIKVLKLPTSKKFLIIDKSFARSS